MRLQEVDIQVFTKGNMLVLYVFFPFQSLEVFLCFFVVKKKKKNPPAKVKELKASHPFPHSSLLLYYTLHSLDSCLIPPCSFIA